MTDTEPGTKREFGILRELSAGNGKFQLALVGVLSLLATASTLVLPWIVGKLLANLGDGGMNRWTWLLVALGIGSALANAAATFLLSRLGQRMICRLRIRTMRHSLSMRMADIRAEGGGNLVARITADTARLKRLIDAGPIQLPMAAVMTVGTLVIMGFIDWVLLLVTLGSFSVAGGMIILVIKALRRSYVDVQESTSALAQRFVSAVDAVKVIKAYQAEDQVMSSLSDKAEEVAGREIGAARMEALMMPAINLGQQVAMVAVIVGGGARMLDGLLSLADFVAFLLYLLQLTGPLMMASTAITAVKMGLVSRERFTGLFAKQVEGAGDAETGAERVAGAPAVQFEDVDFNYGDQPVLRGAGFQVPDKGLTAMVGLSGSGKTTALELIQRFVDSAGGRVRVFGHEVSDWPLHRLRSHMAYLDQTSTLVQDSVRRNLTLGRVDDNLSDEELMAALERVGLAEEIMRTPKGLDTVLAGESDLSGGQRQRLGIARAMLTEAPLVLLDEPSSQLDSINEQKLRDAVDILARDRAVLVVAHRISTVQHADHVVVFDNGRVVGRGDHESLLRDCSQYEQLVRGQELMSAGVPA